MEMYTTPDEARSDLVLAVATYVFGPALVGLLFAVIPLGRVPGVGEATALALPLVFTILVPLLLIRYRRQSLAGHGFGGVDASVPRAVLLAVPVIAAGAAAGLLAGWPVVMVLPAAGLVDLPGGGTIGALARVLRLVGVLLLTAYALTKAPSAFRGQPLGLRDGVTRVGRILAIVGGAALALMIVGDLLSGRGALDGLTLGVDLLQAVGVAGAVWLALRGADHTRTTTLPVLVTGVAVMAIGPFGLFGGVGAFLAGLYSAMLHGAMGLALAVVVQTTGRTTGALVLGLLLGLGSAFGTLSGS